MNLSAKSIASSQPEVHIQALIAVKTECQLSLKQMSSNF